MSPDERLTRLKRLRNLSRRIRAHLDQHGFLWDAPGIDPDDLDFLLDEVERLQRQTEERNRENRHLQAQVRDLRRKLSELLEPAWTFAAEYGNEALASRIHRGEYGPPPRWIAQQKRPGNDGGQ